jgi:DNA ligase 4
MIMFFDILLLDDIVSIREPHDKRRQLLQSLVHCIPGQADIGTREIIDFSSYDAPKLLSEALARAIARRWEGIVLKGCNDPYFSFHGTKSFIKLKKDHIAGLGDTADFHLCKESWSPHPAPPRISSLREGSNWSSGIRLRMLHQKIR